MMHLILSFFAVILIIAEVVTTHELAHMLAAKAVGIQVSEFAIGFGKKLWTHKGKDGTEYSIRLIPLGGFCNFVGDTFETAPVGKRVFISAAGPLCNIIQGTIGFFLRTGLSGFRNYLLMIRDLIVDTLMIFCFQFKLSETGGILDITNTYGRMIAENSGYILVTFAILSLYIGILNLFPLPVLDGGHIAGAVIEKIRGRKLNEKAQMWAMEFSLSVVLVLYGAALIGDFMMLFGLR